MPKTNVIYSPQPALKRLVIYFRKNDSNSMRFACTMISTKLDHRWGPDYIYQVYTGRIPASKKFKGCITRLDQKTFKEKRHWLNIHALTLEQKERWKQIPMDKRRKALDIMFLKVRKDITCEHGCAFVHPYGWVPEDGCPIHDQEERKSERWIFLK